jgi:hypothetical protein
MRYALAVILALGMGFGAVAPAAFAQSTSAPTAVPQPTVYPLCSTGTGCFSPATVTFYTDQNPASVAGGASFNANPFYGGDKN